MAVSWIDEDCGDPDVLTLVETEVQFTVEEIAVAVQEARAGGTYVTAHGGRGITVAQTPEGRHAIVAVRPVRGRHIRRAIVEALTEAELRSFVQAGETILRHLRALDRPAASGEVSRAESRRAAARDRPTTPRASRRRR